MICCFLASRYEETYLRAIPSANQYEKSFMHRDCITHVLTTQTDYIVTASRDGNLKFWKKKHSEGVEFVKHFKCHLRTFLCLFMLLLSHFNIQLICLDAFTHLATNHDGTLLITISAEDKAAKIFDVLNFDMINMFNLEFCPRTAAWIHQQSDVINTVAISDQDSSNIHIFDGKGSSEPLHTISGVHFKPVILIDVS